MYKEIVTSSNTTNIRVLFQRDSFCMADDVIAPNEKEVLFDENTTIKQVLDKMLQIEYIPKWREPLYWEIRANNEIIAYAIISKESSAYKTNKALKKLYDYKESTIEIFCSKNNQEKYKEHYFDNQN